MITATAGVAGSQAYTDGFTTEYVIERGTEYTLDFKKAPLNETVVDYTIEMYDKSGDNWFQKQFDVKFNEKNNAFTVNRLPDNVSLAVFELLVKKLGIDGRIYLERIVIHPIRVSATTTIPLGDYKITDAVKDNATDYLSGVMKTADLAPMFTDLAAQNDHAVEFTNLSERWRNQEKGARNLVLKSVKVGDDDALTTTSTPTIDAQMKIWFGSAAVYQGAASAITVPKLYKNAEGTGNNNVTTNLWEAKSFVYQPYYAYMPAATLLPTFAVNEEIVLTYDITDKDNQYLNTLVITVKPVIPALTTMIKKDLDFWSDDETVLNAYYRDPANYFKTDMPAWYDIALGAYANDAAENVGGSGGFEKIGGAQGTDNEWANLTFSLSGDDKDGNYVYMNNSIGYATKVRGLGAISTADGTYDAANIVWGGIPESVNNKMFGLYYQNSIDLTTDGTAAVAKPNGWKDAYGKELNVIAQAVYLGVYEYKDADDKWLTDANFKIKIMSALFEGEVVAIRNGVEVPAISIPASGAGFAKLTDADITGITYNDVKYSLFEVYDAAITGNRKYMYTYIKQVKFKVAGDNKYFIKAADGVTDTEDAVAPVAATDTNDGKSYVNIKSGNPTQNVETTIGVEVTDRFGKTLKATVPLNITRAE